MKTNVMRMVEQLVDGIQEMYDKYDGRTDVDNLVQLMDKIVFKIKRGRDEETKELKRLLKQLSSALYDIQFGIDMLECVQSDLEMWQSDKM